MGIPEVAEEVVPDAFLTVWLRADQYTPARGGVHTWLLTLVRNRGIGRVRSSRSIHSWGPPSRMVAQRSPLPTTPVLGYEENWTRGLSGQPLQGCLRRSGRWRRSRTSVHVQADLELPAGLARATGCIEY